MAHLRAVKDEPEAGRIAAYKKLCHHFHPAMRHLFRETDRTAAGWFEMRLNFSRTLATTSIVGWMLGIGDRHVSNLMLDRVTGDLIGIDFGIAFESGRLLAVPERVPFRLTRDFVDALGPSGTEGVFRRCAEEVRAPDIDRG